MTRFLFFYILQILRTKNTRSTQNTNIHTLFLHNTRTFSLQTPTSLIKKSLLQLFCLRPLYLHTITILITFSTCFTTHTYVPLKPYTIIINPAGNTHSTERLIENTFERSITLQAAEELKKQLEKLIPTCTVLLTRTPGHVTTQVQNAHFANSLNVNLFISIHFYQETNTKPHVYIYQFSYNNEFAIKPSDFTFYRYEQSYFFNHTSSAHAAHIIEQIWAQKSHAHQFTTHHVMGIPCSSLIGITCPALAFDMGIKNPIDWHRYIQPMLEGIQAIVSANLQNTK